LVTQEIVGSDPVRFISLGRARRFRGHPHKPCRSPTSCRRASGTSLEFVCMGGVDGASIWTGVDSSAGRSLHLTPPSSTTIRVYSARIDRGATFATGGLRQSFFAFQSKRLQLCLDLARGLSPAPRAIAWSRPLDSSLHHESSLQDPCMALLFPKATSMSLHLSQTSTAACLPAWARCHCEACDDWRRGGKWKSPIFSSPRHDQTT
jgi:hypothetical protein